jgi:hypothetical protein
MRSMDEFLCIIHDKMDHEKISLLRLHTVGKLSMRATTLLQTSPQSEVCAQSYGLAKSRESQFWENLGLPSGNLGTK